jgi:hypothetical protein
MPRALPPPRNPARTAVLDNEAVQALTSPHHPKHRRVLAAIEVVASRNLRGAGTMRLVVPTAVRVEAGWDRRRPGAAILNRLRIQDSPLDRESADRAAAIRTALDVSVADSHLGAVVDKALGPVAVLTSDGSDVRRIATHLGVAVNVVAL